MRAINLIQAMPGYGKAKAANVMKECGIAESRRVGDLGGRQKERLLELFSE